MAKVEEGIFQYGEYKFTIKITKGDFKRQTTATSLARARAHKARFLAEWRKLKQNDISTAHEMFDFFISEQEARFRIKDKDGNAPITENTLRNYRLHIKIFKSYFTTTDTLNLTQLEWHNFFVTLQKWRNIKAVTVKKYVETMRFVCKTFDVPFKFKGLRVNDGTEREAFKEHEVDKFILTARDMATAKELPYNIFVLFLLCFYCGARKGELIGLHKDDIKDDTHELYIVKQLADVNGKVYESNTKGKQTGSIFLQTDIYEVLKELKDNGSFNNPYLFENNVENNRRKNQFYLPKTVQRYFNKVLKKAELNPKLCLYSIRHHWTSALFKIGGPEALKTIQKLGRWSSSLPLTQYWQSTPQEQKELLEKAEAQINLLNKLSDKPKLPM